MRCKFDILLNGNDEYMHALVVGIDVYLCMQSEEQSYSHEGLIIRSSSQTILGETLEVSKILGQKFQTIQQWVSHKISGLDHQWLLLIPMIKVPIVAPLIFQQLHLKIGSYNMIQKVCSDM